MQQRVALITGSSQGLGLELARRLVTDGWAVVLDARRRDHLDAAAAEVVELAGPGTVVAVAGDITDPEHRSDLAAAARRLGRVELVVNNASTLGASPLPELTDLDPDTFRRVLDVNVVSPFALVGELAHDLDDGATVLNITSDAAVEAYPTWGGYGASKAALDHASRILAEEHPAWRVLVVDPGEMRTEMHQDAFAGEDISDRPLPATSVPGIVALIDGDQSSGRYLAREAIAADVEVG